MKKIYIAFDIDNTVIFQDRGYFDNSIAKIHISTNSEGVKSYCTIKSFAILKKLKTYENVVLIPVTARTEKKFKDTLLYSDINLNNFIVNVGQKIFFNDVEDIEWKHIVDSKIAKVGNYYDRINNNAIEILGDSIKFEKHYDNFYSVKYNDLIKDKIDLFVSNLENNNLEATFSLNKVNILLEGINKETALKYMLKRYYKIDEQDILIACGDGYLDYSMVKMADISLVPKGSRIANEKGDNFIITQNEKLLAGEEILEHIHSIVLSTYESIN